MRHRHFLVSLAGGAGAALAGCVSCSVHAEPLAMVGAALAQSADPLGTSTPSIAERLVTAAIIIAAAIVGGYGFARLASGRHTIEGLVVVCVAGLGLAKASTIAALLLRVLGVVFG